MDSIRSSTMGVAAAVVCALYGPAVFAQSADASAGASDAGTLEEVVITAQKRTERLEDVPVSAQVVGVNELANSNVSDVSDLNKLVPSLNINGTISGRAPMGIRGISSVSNEQAVSVPSGVAIMVDGVPVPSDSDMGNNIEDVQSVEVLKGPQATLGGSTAAAGIINYVTYNPTDTYQGAGTLLGTTDHEYRASGHLSGPITNGLDFSLSAYDAHRYFPITNEFYGTKADQRDYGVRAKLLWKINDDIEAKLTYHHGTVQQHGFNFVYTHLQPGADLLFTPGPLTQQLELGGIVPSWQNLDYKSPVNTAGHRSDDNDAQLDLSFNLGGGYTLTSTSAYQHESQVSVQDLFAVANYFFDTLVTGSFADPITSDPHVFNNTQLQQEYLTQKSEEIKLVSPVDQPVSFVAGFFYSDSKVEELYHRGLPPAALNLDVLPDTTTYDIYGRATWKVTDPTWLVAGLRYNRDLLSYTYNQVIYNGQGPFYSTGSSSSNAVVGDISLQQHFTPALMVYGTYARGYSPKVYNTAATLSSDAEIAPVNQEHINHFEIGTKGTYLDHRLTLNLSLFDTIYQDYQIQSYQLLPGQITSSLDLRSAGKAITRGGELDTSWRATDLTTISLSGAYIDAYFADYTGAPCEGFAVANVPPANCTAQVGPGGTTFVQNMSGQTMPNAPRWKFYVDGQQKLPLAGLPFDILADVNFAYRTSAQMLPDNNPNAVMGAFGITNISLGLQSKSGKWSITAFCNNLFNKVWYQDVEDFWNGPWSNTSTVIAEPARDAVRYGGIRINASL
ncbi:MAG TPA: TonB-dependent receptor [Steroidobacteraceae bacterium]